MRLPASGKLLIAGAAIVLAIIVPTVWSLTGSHGYFYSGRCTCNFPIYTYLRGDGYFQYSPGHGRPGHRLFTIRRIGNEWEVLEQDGNVLSHLRLQDGDLWQFYSGSKTWARYPRVHNPWVVWAAATKEDAQRRWNQHLGYPTAIPGQPMSPQPASASTNLQTYPWQQEASNPPPEPPPFSFPPPRTSPPPSSPP